MWHLLLLFTGFVPLIIGANILVDNASSLAKRLNIPAMVIGLTIVGFGTSAPELVVNLFASVEKNYHEKIPIKIEDNIPGFNLQSFFYQ